MGWIEENLEPAEEIVFETRPHWSIFLLPLLLIIMTTVNIWILLPALALLFYDSYQFFSQQYIVTNRRLIQKQGMYYIRIKDWPLPKIEDVICTRTMADRLFGSGSVILMGIAIQKSHLRGVGHPFELRNAIYSQLPTK